MKQEFIDKTNKRRTVIITDYASECADEIEDALEYAEKLRRELNECALNKINLNTWDQLNYIKELAERLKLIETLFEDACADEYNRGFGNGYNEGISKER